MAANLAELPKDKLVQRAEKLSKGATSLRKKVQQNGAHIGRALARKGGQVEGAVETYLVGRYLDDKPGTQKTVHGASFGIKTALAAVADAMGFEGVAGALDASASNNTGMLSHEWGKATAKKDREEKAKEGAGAGRGAAASPAPSTPAAAPAATPAAAKKGGKSSDGFEDYEQTTGELWQENGMGQRPTVEGYGYTIHQQGAGRPMRGLAARHPLIAQALKRQLDTNGYEASDENVGAILDNADSVVGTAADVPATGEILETGALGLGIASLLAQLAQLPAAMRSLPQVVNTPAPAPTTSGLDDGELLAASTMGVLDPDDVTHIVTSGYDDGRYLSTSGDELDASAVRSAMSTRLDGMETGAIGDGWRAFWDRQKLRAASRKKRKQERISSDRKRVELEEKAKELRLQKKLNRQEGRAQGKVNQAQSEYDTQVSQTNAENAASAPGATTPSTSQDPAEADAGDDMWAQQPQ